MADLLREHMQFKPYHEGLSVDLIGKTQVSPKNPTQTTARREVQVTHENVYRSLDATFGKYDNSVVYPTTPMTPLLSTLNLSALNSGGAQLGLSELKSSKEQRREALLQQLAELDARESPVPSTQPIVDQATGGGFSTSIAGLGYGTCPTGLR